MILEIVLCLLRISAQKNGRRAFTGKPRAACCIRAHLYSLSLRQTWVAGGLRWDGMVGGARERHVVGGMGRFRGHSLAGVRGSTCAHKKKNMYTTINISKFDAFVGRTGGRKKSRRFFLFFVWGETQDPFVLDRWHHAFCVRGRDEAKPRCFPQADDDKEALPTRRW